MDQGSKIISSNPVFPKCWMLAYLPHHFWDIPIFTWGFPSGSAGKESACSVGDLGSMPGLGRSPEEGKSYPLQYSGLENSMNCIVHGVAKSRTWPNDFHIYLIFWCWNWLTPYLKLSWKETWHYITLGKAESFFIRRRYHYISNKEYITF